MVTLDGNHPLAGQNLNFDVEVAEVRAATAEELSHGHVHGPAATITEQPASLLLRCQAREHSRCMHRPAPGTRADRDRRSAALR